MDLKPEYISKYQNIIHIHVHYEMLYKFIYRRQTISIMNKCSHSVKPTNRKHKPVMWVQKKQPSVIVTRSSPNNVHS